MQYQLRYGADHLAIDLDPQQVRAVLQPHPAGSVADIAAAAAKSQDEPLHSPPLNDVIRGADSALIVTVNHTRPSPRQMIEPILERCRQAGVAVTVCIAGGRHRQMTESEIAAHLGRKIMDEATVTQHDPFDLACHRDLGTTLRGTRILVDDIVFKHDVVIGVGIIEPSYLLGWSGGRKLMMPGLAYAESIDNNHFYLTAPGAVIGRLDGNPLSEDAEEFARKVPFHFITYWISGPDDEAVELISGDPFLAHREACRRAERIYTVERVTAPVIIASAGGAPYDCNLVQGKKAILPGIELVEHGGAVILLAECPEGHGAEQTFLDWICTKTPQEIVRDVRNRELFSLGAHGANILARPVVEKNASVILVTCDELRAQLKGSFVQTAGSLEEAWRMACRKVGELPDVVICNKARRLICRA